MRFQLTTDDIALVFMLAGTLSLVMHERLAKLDSLVVKGGPFRMEQDRMRLSQRMIVLVGIALLVLAVALVSLR